MSHQQCSSAASACLFTNRSSWICRLGGLRRYTTGATTPEEKLAKVHTGVLPPRVPLEPDSPTPDPRPPNVRAPPGSLDPPPCSCFRSCAVCVWGGGGVRGDCRRQPPTPTRPSSSHLHTFGSPWWVWYIGPEASSSVSLDHQKATVKTTVPPPSGGGEEGRRKREKRLSYPVHRPHRVDPPSRFPDQYTSPWVKGRGLSKSNCGSLELGLLIEF